MKFERLSLYKLQLMFSLDEGPRNEGKAHTHVKASSQLTKLSFVWMMFYKGDKEKEELRKEEIDHVRLKLLRASTILYKYRYWRANIVVGAVSISSSSNSQSLGHYRPRYKRRRASN